MAAIPFQPMMESRPIREIAYEVLKHAIITGFACHFRCSIPFRRMKCA